LSICSCEIGDDVKIGTFVEIQKASKSDRCKISSHTFIAEGVTLEDGFRRPQRHVTTTVYPRATNGTGNCKPSRLGLHPNMVKRRFHRFWHHVALRITMAEMP